MRGLGEGRGKRGGHEDMEIHPPPAQPSRFSPFSVVSDWLNPQSQDSKWVTSRQMLSRKFETRGMWGLNSLSNHGPP